VGPAGGTSAPTFTVRGRAAALGQLRGLASAGGDPSVDYWNVLLPSGTPIGRFLGTPSGGSDSERRYYHTDHLGSTRAVTDQSGTVVERRDHYPFGLQMPGRTLAQGPRADEDYTGHQLDEETGMHYAGARFYMSALGRWGTTDPLADDFPAWSPYNYVQNNPISLLDPDGQAPEGCCLEKALRDSRGDRGTLSGYNSQMTNLGGVSASDIPDVPDGIQRRAGGAVKVIGGVGMAVTPVGSSGIAGKVILVGAGSLTAGSGTVDMAVGDEPGIPSYSGGGDMVTRGTDYELAGQAFDFGVGLLAPTGRLKEPFGEIGVVLDVTSTLNTGVDGNSLLQSLSEEESPEKEPLQGTVFEGGIQAPDHRTRDDRLNSGTTISSELRDER